VRQTARTFVRNPVKALFIGAIRAYQVFVSPGLPGRCKYYPSCSHYAIDAIRDYGAARGSILAAWRILRCNPLSNGGYDPVSRQKLFATRCSHGDITHPDAAHTHGAAAGSPALPGRQGLGG
jgi:uncharacterized protein